MKTCFFMLVTHWENHWDELKNNITFYTKKLIPEQLLNNLSSANGVNTYFVKIKEKDSSKVEHIYKGKIWNIEEEDEKVKFKIELEKKIKNFDILPIELPKKSGWYIYEIILDRYFRTYFFVMVTHWENHWVGLKNGITYYTKNFVPEQIFNDPTKANEVVTYFVKMKQNISNEIEHVYKGKVLDVKKEGENLKFKVKLDNEIKDLDILPIRLPTNPGWFLYGIERLDKIQGWEKEHENLLPPFFKELQETKNWEKFEEFIYYLIKLIGINDIIRYNKSKQAGLSDGVFRIGKLVVIYDATLKDIKDKHEQINNYANKLKSDKLNIDKNTLWEIKDKDKEVWIITQSGSSKLIRKEENVKIKQISVIDLINFYEMRLKEINNEEDLQKKLQNFKGLKNGNDDM